MRSARDAMRPATGRWPRRRRAPRRRRRTPSPRSVRGPRPAPRRTPAPRRSPPLEVVAEREVAEHLEEGQVAGGVARRSRCRRCESSAEPSSCGEQAGVSDAQVVGLVLLHAGRREQHARIAGRHQRGRLADEVAARGEEVAGSAGEDLRSSQCRPSHGRHAHGSPLARRAVRQRLTATSPISRRSFSSERRMSRDTCICEMPTRAGDLRLREAFEEAQMEDVALARVELGEARREHRAVLHGVVGRFFGTHVVDQAGLVVARPRR